MASKTGLFKKSTEDDTNKWIGTNEPIDIYGFKDPKIVKQSGRDFIIVKERHRNKILQNNKYTDDIGLLFKKDKDDINMDVIDEINYKLYKKPSLGGYDDEGESIEIYLDNDGTLNNNILNKVLENDLFNIFNEKIKDNKNIKNLNIDVLYNEFLIATHENFSKDKSKILNDDRTDSINLGNDNYYFYNPEDNEVLIKSKRILNNISTDFFTEKVFKNQETIYYFQLLVNKLFSEIIDKYKREHKIDKYDIIFLFKGGTTNKILYDTYHEKYFKNDNLDNVYKQFFKRSDSDYSVYINPRLDNVASHRKNIIKLLFITLNTIRNILGSHSDIFFDPINKNDLLELIIKYNTEIKNLPKDKLALPEYDILKNIEVVGVLFKDNLVFVNEAAEQDFFTDRNYYVSNIDTTFVRYIQYYIKSLDKLKTKNNKRKDFYITNKKIYFFKDDNTNYINNENNIYMSFNDDIKNINPQFKINFSLLRLKYNFTIFYKKDSKYGILNVPSELIDISINSNEDGSIINAYKNDIKKYIINYKYNNKLNYNGYSIDGYISDFINQLFKSTNNPWSDKKYEKKIARLSYFLLLKLLIENYTRERKIKYIDNLINLLKFEYTSENLPKIHNIIDDTIIEYKDDNVLIYILEGLKLIYSNVTGYILNTKLIKIQEYLLDNIELYNNFRQTLTKYMEENKKIITNHNKIDLITTVPVLGGYYKKYIKYKTKYIELKNNLKL
jgi:hypothetical protein